MPPKTPVQNYADFVYLCSILKDDHTLAQGYGENLSDDTICQLKTQFKEINRIYLAIRKADPNFAVSFPELKGKRDELHKVNNQLIKSFEDSRFAAEIAANVLPSNQNVQPQAAGIPVPNVDDEIDLSLSELNCKFQMLECKVSDACEEVQKFLDNSPTPTAYDCEEVKILLFKLSEAKDLLT